MLRPRSFLPAALTLVVTLGLAGLVGATASPAQADDLSLIHI